MTNRGLETIKQLNTRFEISNMLFSTTVTGKHGDAFRLNPFDKKIHLLENEDPGIFVVRLIISVSDASRIISGDEFIQILDKYKTAANEIMDVLLEANCVDKNNFTPPSFTMPGFKDEYFRILSDTTGYELRLYTEVK